MANGTIYLTNDKQTIEVIVTPETLENIEAAKEECLEEGIRITTAQIIGNFAITLTDEISIADVRKVINGEIVE